MVKSKRPSEIYIELPSCFRFFCPRQRFHTTDEGDGTPCRQETTFNFSCSETSSDHDEHEFDGETENDQGENVDRQVEHQSTNCMTNVKVSRKQLKLKVGDTSLVDGWSTDGTRVDSGKRQFDRESLDSTSWVSRTKQSALKI